MIAVTIGCDDYLPLAEYSANRFHTMTGIPVHIIKNADLPVKLKDARHAKFFIPSILQTSEQIIYFDADLILTRPVDFSTFVNDQNKIYVCRDLPISQIIDKECSKFSLDRHNYFNSGLLVFNPTLHKEWLTESFRIAERGGSVFSDQTYLNMALNNLEYSYEFLPTTFNAVDFKLNSTDSVLIPYGIHVTIRKLYEKNKDAIHRVISEADAVVVDEYTYKFDYLKKLSGVYEYHRVNIDKRILELRNDGTIGYNKKRMELFWHPVECKTNGSLHIVIDNLESTTCVLNSSMKDGVCESFSGDWLKYEKSKTTLVKLS